MRSRWLFSAVVLVGMFRAAGASGQSYVPGELVVQFQPGTAAATRADIHQSLGAVVRRRIPEIDVDLVALATGSDVFQAAARYVAHREVAYAEPNWLLTVAASSASIGSAASTAALPNDPGYARQWGLGKIQAPLAWSITQGQDSIAVAILSSGIDAAHPDLAGKVIASELFSDSPTPDDLLGQGTHLAGIVAAVANNGVGIAGLAPRCWLLDAKVARDDGRARAAWIAQGILWATDSGAQVICIGVGSPAPSSILEDAVKYAWAHNVLLVAAADSTGQSAPIYPAAYPACMAVAATDPGDLRPNWSGFGPWVSVAAPGQGIYSTLPVRGTQWGAGYGAIDGTAEAAAFVAGLAALVWSTPFGTSNAAVRARIEQTCDRIPGTGILWTAGRINAARAVGAMP
jgi:thermitase